MNHAGMIPVFAESDQAADGLFSLPFEWTMGGSWIVEARLTRPNGDVASQTFNVEILTEAGEHDHATMDQGGSDQAAGDVSAVYMRITNQGASDRVIVSAASAAAERIEFHRTIVENDIARMEPLDNLLIPAGGTLTLQPGGAHIMLRGLAADLQPADKFSLQLKCDTGEVYELDISIANMMMTELNDAVEHGDLVFSNRWARPAKAGGSAHGDMPNDRRSRAFIRPLLDRCRATQWVARKSNITGTVNVAARHAKMGPTLPGRRRHPAQQRRPPQPFRQQTRQRLALRRIQWPQQQQEPRHKPGRPGSMPARIDPAGTAPSAWRPKQQAAATTGSPPVALEFALRKIDEREEERNLGGDGREAPPPESHT